MKFYYSDLDSNPEIGDLIKWRDLPIGGYAGLRRWYGSYYSPLPTVLSKPDWMIDPDHSASTYLQGITLSIDPNQHVMYLGMVEDSDQRIALLEKIDNNSFPMEAQNV